jgi:hypothetical protein
MIGEMRSGTRAIDLSVTDAKPPSDLSKPTAARPEVTNVVHETSGHLLVLMNYLALVIGTLITVILMAWERRGTVTVKTLRHRLVYLECITFSMVNVSALAVVVPVFVDASTAGSPNSTTSTQVQMLARLTGTWQGNLALGVALTITLMKTISFVRADD